MQLARRLAALAAATLVSAAAAAQEPAWGPEAAGLRASISMGVAELRIGELFVIRVRFKNVSDRPTSLHDQDYHAGADLVIRDEKGEPVLCMKACVDYMMPPPKTFFHALKPGETFSVEVRGRVRYQFVDAARRPANDADREIYVDFSDETFGPVHGGKFTAALRYAVDEKSAELGRKLGFDPVWTGEVTSDKIEFSIRAMTREELDRNLTRLEGGSAAEKLEAAEVAGANADLKASRALMAMLAAGGGKDLWQVAEALGAIQDTSLVGELQEIYRRSLKEPERGPSDRPNVILNAIRGLEPDRAKLNAFLVEVLKSDAPVAVRTFAMNGLSLERDAEALGAVVAVAKKPAPRCR